MFLGSKTGITTTASWPTTRTTPMATTTTTTIFLGCDSIEINLVSVIKLVGYFQKLHRVNKACFKVVDIPSDKLLQILKCCHKQSYSCHKLPNDLKHIWILQVFKNKLGYQTQVRKISILIDCLNIVCLFHLYVLEPRLWFPHPLIFIVL